MFLSRLLIKVTTPPNGRPINMPDSIRLDIAERPKEKKLAKYLSNTYKLAGANQYS